MQLKRYFLLLILFVLQSCHSNNPDQSVLNENRALKREINMLKQKISQSIVIPQKKIHEYFYPLSFGPTKTKINESIEFKTCIVLRKFPEGTNVSWKSTPEAMNVTNNGLTYTVKGMYPGTGHREYRGNYTITYPDKQQVELTWLREFDITNN